VYFSTLKPSRSFDGELKESVCEATRGEEALVDIYSQHSQFALTAAVVLAELSPPSDWLTKGFDILERSSKVANLRDRPIGNDRTNTGSASFCVSFKPSRTTRSYRIKTE
jgi:hypothetical protein